MAKILFLKSHVKGYTRADGTYVRPHEDKRRKKEFGSQLATLARRAYEGLSDDARRAVDSWNVNWTTGALERAFRDGTPLADEIRAAFEPVRKKLRELYGDTVPLWRGESRGGSEKDGRKLFSWTPLPSLAEKFAFNNHRGVPKAITDDDVQRVVDQYNRTGFAKFGRYKFKRMADAPGYFGIYEGRHNEFITDGDDIEQFMRGEQKDRAEWIAELKSRGDTYAADVPIDSLVWIPTGINLREPEFIAMYNPRKQPAALMAKAIVFLRA